MILIHKAKEWMREGRFLQGYRKRFPHMETSSHGGPLVLIDGQPNADESQLAARLTARYSQGRNAEQTTVGIKPLDADAYSIDVQPYPASQTPKTGTYSETLTWPTINSAPATPCAQSL